MCKINNCEFSHVLLGMKIYCFEFWVRYLSGLDSFITSLKEISNFWSLLSESAVLSMSLSFSWWFTGL